jgi:uncharacterized protein (TIGR00251 family)
MSGAASDELQLQVGDGWIVIPVRVQPRASSEGMAGVVDGALKVRLTAPPVEGKANRALQAFLARVLEVPKGNVAIVSGDTARLKRVRIEGVSPRDLAARIPKIRVSPDSAGG